MSGNDVLAAMLAAAFVYVCYWHAARGATLGRALSKKAGEAVAGGLLALTVALVLVVQWFPLSLPTAVWTGPLCMLEHAAFALPASAFFGLAGTRLPEERVRRSLAVLNGLVVIIAGLHFFLALAARQHPGLVDRPFDGPVCRQSTGWSCGAAACATMLKARGVATTEREMGELCLTYRGRGTTLPRFVRGLALKAERDGLPWTVEVRTGLDMDGLERFPLPCVIAIRWTFLVDHAVAVLGRDAEGGWLIGEVSVGAVQRWSREELEAKFLGEAVTLRPGAP